jgi:hypothetical protein
MKKNILIGIIGDDKDAGKILFKSLSKFQPNKIILLIKEKSKKNSKKIIKEIEKLNIEYETKEISNYAHLEEIFIKIKKISELYKNDSIVIQVDCDYLTSCLSLSSAFVNGILAIGILNNEIISYPIMKFSYYNAINKKKLEILKIINKNKNIESMEELAKLTKLSLPLIAYHLRGNRDSKGLIEMNLVETKKENGKIKIKLTQLGKLIINDAIDYSCENNKK